MNVNSVNFKIITGAKTYVKVQVDNEGVSTHKTITYEDFVTLIMGSTFASERTVYGPFPPGTVFYLDRQDGFSLMVDVPPCKRVMVIAAGRNREAYDVCFPRLLLEASCTKGVLKGMHCFAVKGVLPITEKTSLYRYPFSNVYHDGKVCLGGNTGTDITDPMGLWHVMENIMFLSPSNGDMFETVDGRNFSDFVKAMSEMQAYPEELLKDLHLTVADIL